MKRSLSSISAVIALALATSALPAPAAAQAPPDDATKAAARTLAETGKARFESGDYKGAIEALRDAEKYFKAPTITRMRAMAHEKLEQLLEAQALHRQIATDPLPAGAPPEFVTAQAESQKAVASLETRIPKLQIVILNPPAGTSITLDGKPVDAAAIAQPMRINPGKYALVITPPGKAPIRHDLVLAEAANEKVQIDLAPPPPPPLVPTAPTGPSATGTAPGTATPPTAPPSSGRSMLGPAIAFGVGGAGLIAGAITGGLSFGVADEVKQKCGEGLVCPSDMKGKVEEGKTFGLVSTIGFAVAGVGAAVGVVLLLIPSGNKTEPAKVGVAVGPGFTGVKGAF